MIGVTRKSPDMVLTYMNACPILFMICVVGYNALHHSKSSVPTSFQKVKTLTFLITVNDTWDPSGCIQTVRTPSLFPQKLSSPVTVGKCDHGPIGYNILSSNDQNLMQVNVTFYSSVIEDAGPPNCQIPWNGTYVLPTPTSLIGQMPSVLPGCYVVDSREGYHQTYYWFYLIDWMFE